MSPKKLSQTATKNGSNERGIIFNPEKQLKIYSKTQRMIVILPKNDYAKLLVVTVAKQVKASKETLSEMKVAINRMAKELPEYDTVMAMCGVGEATGVQLMVEIEDVRRFAHRSSIVAFAGVDPSVNQSGKE